MHFTSCPVQIYKIMLRRFLFSRIWSSAQDYAVLGLLLNPVGFWISVWQICQLEMICIGSILVLKRHFGGASLQYFTWFIGAGGCDLYFNNSTSGPLKRRLIGVRIHPCPFVTVGRRMFPLRAVHYSIPGGGHMFFWPSCLVSTQWLSSSKRQPRGGRRFRSFVHFCALHSQCWPKTVFGIHKLARQLHQERTQMEVQY